MPPEIVELRKSVRMRAMTDFQWFARHILKIRTKNRGIVPFELNRAQRHVHETLEKHRRETGKVRAVILKARQEGISTYIEGRFYHKTIFNEGVRTFILTHQEEATKNIFEMVDLFHERCHPDLRPLAGKASEKELFFDRLRSGYKVGTAGNKTTGRSQTVQYLHWSEVAHSPNAMNIQEGLLQAVGDEGTEIVYESTANGFDPVFYPLCQKAESGQSEFIFIFIPWFWMGEYASPVPPGFVPTAEEKDLIQIFGLTLEQVVWRRNKIRDDFNGKIERFMQEYPATATEAFQTTGHESFIPPALVMKARKTLVEFDPAKYLPPLVIGVDPAVSRDGDRTAVVFRRGRCMNRVDYHQGKDGVEVANLIHNLITKHNPYRVFVDSIGIGSTICDILYHRGLGNVAVGVNSATTDGIDKERYHNKRAEMAARFLEWIKDPLGVQIPDSDEFATDLLAFGYGADVSNRLKIESKKEYGKRVPGGRSPDGYDAAVLTFAELDAVSAVNGDLTAQLAKVEGSYHWKTG